MSPLEMYLLRAAIAWLMPPRRRVWAEAMLGELSDMDASAARRWAFECVLGAVRFRATDLDALVIAALLVSAPAMILVDWRSGATVPTLAMICGLCGVLGFSRPQYALRLGLSSGAIVPIAHLIADNIPALWPAYQYKPLDGLDLLILASVLVPAIIASYAGRKARMSQIIRMV